MRTVEYVNRDSILHRLDPRVNLLVSITVLTAAFLFTETAYLVGAFCTALGLVVLGQIWREFLPWMKILLLFGVVSFFMWTFFSNLALGATESTTIAELWIIEVTERGLSQGVSMPFRIMTMISIPIIFMMTVKNSDLIKALRQLGMPYKIAFGFGLALRLVYVFQDQIRTIREAQQSRGAVLDRGSPITRIKNNLPVLVPAMVRGFESSDNLSTTLDLKGFDNVNQRTTAYQLEASKTDIIIAIVSLSVLVVILLSRLLGYGTAG